MPCGIGTPDGGNGTTGSGPPADSIGAVGSPHLGALRSAREAGWGGIERQPGVGDLSRIIRRIGGNQRQARRQVAPRHEQSSSVKSIAATPRAAPVRPTSQPAARGILGR